MQVATPKRCYIHCLFGRDELDAIGIKICNCFIQRVVVLTTSHNSGGRTDLTKFNKKSRINDQKNTRSSNPERSTCSSIGSGEAYLNSRYARQSYLIRKSKTSPSVGILVPLKKGFNLPPASRARRSANDCCVTGPEPSVVRSRVLSWITTIYSSEVTCKSTSIKSKPAAKPHSSAGNVFLGAIKLRPRWQTISNG